MKSAILSNRLFPHDTKKHDKRTGLQHEVPGGKASCPSRTVKEHELNVSLSRGHFERFERKLEISESIF